MTALNSPLSIRKATPHDIKAIRDIAFATWPQAYGNILTPAALQYMLDLFYSTKALEQQMSDGQEFFIACGDAPVGFASISPYDEKDWKLNKLYVLPSLHKTGAGKALMQHVVNTAASHGAEKLYLNVNRFNKARDFYERRGFTIIKEEDVDLGNGIVQEDYVMMLKIAAYRP